MVTDEYTVWKRLRHEEFLSSQFFLSRALLCCGCLNSFPGLPSGWQAFKVTGGSSLTDYSLGIECFLYASLIFRMEEWQRIRLSVSEACICFIHGVAL